MTHCHDNGINFFDCWMVDPEIRDHIGDVIKDNRKEWVIQGHIGATCQYVKTREVKPVKESFEDLLKRFHTNYIDFRMIHYVDKKEDYDNIFQGEFYKYLLSLKNEGKVKHFGISTHNPEIGILAALNPDIELIMFSVNPAYDMFAEVELTSEYHDEKKFEGLAGVDPIRDEFYKKCQETNTSITVMKAYAGGRLLNEKESPFKIKLSPVQCISYALNRPSVKSVLLGLKSVSELNSALEYETASDGEKDYNTTLKDAPLHSFAGKCIYCGHCAPCTVGINIAEVNKYYDLGVDKPSIPDTVKAHYMELEYTAWDCIGCGECLSRCPFNVDIIESMNKAKELFK